MSKSFLLFSAFCLSLSFSSFAQEKYDDLVSIGDELIIGTPSKSNYQYIAVPRKNFIIKKGGIANISSIQNNRVIVSKLTYGKDNNPTVVLKKSNGNKFFNAYRTLKADLNKAIANGELRLNEGAKSEGDIAQ